MATTKFALIVLTSKVDPSITQYNDNSDDHHCLCNCLSRSTDKPFLEEEARRLSTLNDNTYKVIKTTDLTILKGFTEAIERSNANNKVAQLPWLANTEYYDKAMKGIHGSFAKSLMECWTYAGGGNRERLVNAFPDYFSISTTKCY